MQDQPIDFSRKWYVMSAVAMGIFLATIDGSIVNVALPTLVRELDTNFATVQWVVLAYLLTISTLLLSVGRLGDMIGKKPIYVTGFVVFTVGSVLCGLAWSVYWLIAFRVVQAVGGAMVFGLGIAIVTEAFPPGERGKALGLAGTVVSVGIVLGPTLGGFIIDAISWHWIFLVNLPVGIVGSLMAARFVPATKPAGRQKFDFPGAITMFISLLALLLGLTWGQQVGFNSPQILVLFAVWAVFLTIFLIIEWRSAQPMVELELFQNNLFSTGLVTGFFTFVSIAGSVILLPFYLENVLGYSVQQVGLLLAVVPIVLGVVAPASGILSDRVGTRPITVLGLVVLLVGYLAMSTLSAETSAWGYVLRLLPVGLGMGIFQSPNNSAIMGAVARQRLGIASGLLSLTRTLGQTTGIAMLGAFWASRVNAFAGEILAEGATAAPVAAQIAGLQQTFLAVAGLVTIALVLSVWGLVQERRLKTDEIAPPVSQHVK
jgi:EmrB/QacA subfamily drug resistance transporter